MKETARIKKMFEDLYAGQPWIDVTILDTLKNLDAQKAAKKIASDWNSIWEILNHVIDWRVTVLQRVQGRTVPSPENNFFKPVEDVSEEAWQTTLRKLEDSQHQWTAYLDEFNEDEFEQVYAANNLSSYEHIHGILQHDAYHLGQIVMLAKRA